jgi:hypothetical protein
MGEPNATATPAALAAVTMSRILPASRSMEYQWARKKEKKRNGKTIPWLRENFENKPATSDPMQQAT